MGAISTAAPRRGRRRTPSGPRASGRGARGVVLGRRDGRGGARPAAVAALDPPPLLHRHRQRRRAQRRRQPRGRAEAVRSRPAAARRHRSRAIRRVRPPPRVHRHAQRDRRRAHEHLDDDRRPRSRLAGLRQRTDPHHARRAHLGARHGVHRAARRADRTGRDDRAAGQPAARRASTARRGATASASGFCRPPAWSAR